MAAATAIQSLPNELRLCIVEYLDQPSLSHLGRTNNRFHQLTQPVLYEAFQGSKLALFLRSVTTPTTRHVGPLTQLVKRVRCVVPQIGDNDADLSDDDRHRIYASILELSLPPHEKARPNLSSDYQLLSDAFQHNLCLSSFLLFFPNLEEIEIQGTWEWNDQLRWFSQFIVKGDHFQHMRSITLCTEVDVYNLFVFTGLPSLRELILHKVVKFQVADTETRQSEGHIAYAGAGKAFWVNFSQRRSSVEKLVILNGLFSIRYFCELLHCLTALKHLEYQLHGQDRHDLEPADVNATVLATCISRYTPTLEYLRLASDGIDLMVAGNIVSTEILEVECSPRLPDLHTLDLGPIDLPGTAQDGKRDLVGILSRHLVLHLPRKLRILRLAFRGEGSKNYDVRLVESLFMAYLMEWVLFFPPGLEELHIKIPTMEGVADRFSDHELEHAFTKHGIKFIWETGLDEKSATEAYAGSPPSLTSS